MALALLLTAHTGFAAVTTLTTRPALFRGALSPPSPRGRRTGAPAMMPHPVRLPFSARDYLKSTGSRTLTNDWIASGMPRWVTLIDELLFVVAAAIFVRGSFDFYPSATYSVYLEGCELFILGSLLQLVLALFATYEIVEDARRSNRDPEPSLLVEQMLYVAGSILFTVGTVLFTPPIGFLSSLGGIRTPEQPPPVEAVEAVEAAQTVQALQAAPDGLVGGLLSATVGAVGEKVAGTADAVASAAGSVAEKVTLGFFGTSVELQGGEIWAPDGSLLTGDVLFVAGSILFSIAAFVSALKAAGESGGDAADALRRRTAVATASLYELGSVAYVIGTLGYIPAGSLGIAECPAGVRTLGNAGASLFVAGSAFYTLGAFITFLAVAYITYEQPYNDGGAAAAQQGRVAEEEEEPGADAWFDSSSEQGSGGREEGVWNFGGDGGLGASEESVAERVGSAFSALGGEAGLFTAANFLNNGMRVSDAWRGYTKQRADAADVADAEEPRAGDATPRADLVAIAQYLAESDAADVLSSLSPWQRRELAARLQAAPDEVVRIRTAPSDEEEGSSSPFTPAPQPVLEAALGEEGREGSLAADALVEREAMLTDELQRAKEMLAAAASREAVVAAESTALVARRAAAQQDLDMARAQLGSTETMLERARAELDLERLGAEDARDFFS